MRVLDPLSTGPPTLAMATPLYVTPEMVLVVWQTAATYKMRFEPVQVCENVWVFPAAALLEGTVVVSKAMAIFCFDELFNLPLFYHEYYRFTITYQPPLEYKPLSL